MAEHRSIGRGLMWSLILLGLALLVGTARAQTYDPSPPAEPVKLIFVHHSSGENWLADENGGLGRTLGENNYFVSDTNYGWGPDGIGDRTDIPNWPEWFTGPESARYLAALYAESGQNSWYTRDLADPGGENEIILFKSCFPNSNLEGNPDDPPAREGDWLSVGNAKAIYNELLNYFATRPDKLFVVITAPPVSDPSYGANARAFNNWLVNDWLADYEGSNVAVFDFYNVLTGPDTHHRFQDSYIEHGWGANNTAYYVNPGDDHPTAAGNRKATEEFVPLLNVFYHLWQPGAPSGQTPSVEPAEATAEPEPVEVPTEPAAAGSPLLALPEGWIDDFEGSGVEWAVFDDGTGQSHLTCGPDPREAYTGCCGLLMDYEIVAEGWASCSLVYPTPQDWGGAVGLSFWLRAERAGQPVVVVAYQGESEDALNSFEYRLETEPAAVENWQRVQINWDQMVQPAWEGDGDARFDPGWAMGVAFVFDEGSGSGALWVDEVSLLAPGEAAEEPAPQTGEVESAEPEPVATEDAVPTAPEPELVEEQEPEEKDGGSGICPGSTAIALLGLAAVVWTRERSSERAT